MPSRDAKPVIYLIGTSGHPNYGDELITAGWLRHLARTAPDAEVWLDSPRPGPSTVLFDGIHPGLRCVDTLFHACWNAPDAGPDEVLDFGHRVVREPGLIPRESAGVENLERVDVVHVLGGGYINGLWPHHLALLGAAREISDRYGARTALTGAGLTPLVPGSERPVGEVLSGFDVVDVRDEESLSAVRDLVPRVTCSGDDAFLALRDDLYDRKHLTRTVLCLQSDLLEVGLAEVAEYVVRTLRAWDVDQERVTLVECIPPDDAKVVPLLEPHLPRLELLPFSGLWRHGLPAGPGQRWISTRFHPHLVTAATGTWGLAIPISSGYYRTKHESLTRLGSGWTIAPDLGDPVAPQRPATEPYGGRLGEIRAGKAAVADAVAALVSARID